MRTAPFKKMLGAVKSLTRKQLEELQKVVGELSTTRNSLAFIESARAPLCHHCNSPRVVRNGNRDGLQRYLCRDCKKTCNAATDTPLSRLRFKDWFEAFAKCMQARKSVRQTAEEVGIAVSTAHRWRLRFLDKVRGHQPNGVAGMLEVDETYFRESQKGSRHLTRPARKRGGKAAGRGRKAGDWVPVLVGRVRGQAHIVDKVLTRVSTAEVTEALKDVVLPGQTVVCTDGHSAFLRLEKTLGVAAKMVVTSYEGHVSDGVYHVQNVNNYHQRLKTWIQGVLRGVASKNLPSYLAWMRLQSWGMDGVAARDYVISALGRQVINL